ncbi:hypothetical protein LNKW23_31780 [Paralimibaculum aggregatum]|uniref:L-lactate permease n=1 Tax=Paralimibaculum aggregatum TaxID=3036245 RepID=A0ABQ6LNQ7_9RHOB|nr:L-lactate permease [Limibaculum sp. NKW23]GMG83964.1 hypothetical protein LNKW23_31780 [Limibaculum sp. NKW23]
MILVWLCPIILFVGLLVSRRASPVAAAALATALSAVVAVVAAPVETGAAEAVAGLLAGFWIALPAVLVILAGLFFAESTGGGGVSSGPAPSHGALAGSCLLIGPFLETATGFGVGYVVALAGVVRLGVTGGRALALAAFSQFLVPWGALGVGTRISAEISGIPVEALALRCALLTTVAVAVILPLFWRVARGAGFAPSRRERIEWSATLGGLSALLVLASLAMPIEFAALAALGAVLLLRHLAAGREDRPDPRAALPYVALVLLLAATRFLPPLREALETLRFAPFAGLSALAPLMSPALLLLLIGAAVSWRRGGRGAVVSGLRAMLRRGWRAAAMTFLLVGMAWIMVRSGISAALMGQATGAVGAAAPALVPLAGAFGGYLTGSNTGAGALSMPLIAGLRIGPEVVPWVGAAAVFAGSALTAISPVRFAMGQALISASGEEAQAGFRLLLPYTLNAILLAVAAALLAAMLL